MISNLIETLHLAFTIGKNGLVVNIKTRNHLEFF